MVNEKQSLRKNVSLARKISPYIIFFALVLFGSFMGLGVLRLYSFRLECKLNSINSQIESFQAQQVELKQRLSSLLSPGRIYGYSKKDLGMVYASNVKVLRIDEPLLAELPETGNRNDTAASRENEGWFYFFLEKALAGE